MTVSEDAIVPCAAPDWPAGPFRTPPRKAGHPKWGPWDGPMPGISTHTLACLPAMCQTRDSSICAGAVHAAVDKLTWVLSNACRHTADVPGSD